VMMPSSTSVTTSRWPARYHRASGRRRPRSACGALGDGEPG